MEATDHSPVCPFCAGPLVYLGQLARLIYGRCRDCGRLRGMPVCNECLGDGGTGDETEGTYELCDTCQGMGVQPQEPRHAIPSKKRHQRRSPLVAFSRSKNVTRGTGRAHQEHEYQTRGAPTYSLP